MEDFIQCPNLFMHNTRTSAGISDSLWLSDEQNLLVASDSGILEIWSCSPPGNSLELRGSLKSHDDMVLCVCRLGGGVAEEGGDKVVSGGADGRYVRRETSSIMGNSLSRCPLNNYGVSFIG